MESKALQNYSNYAFQGVNLTSLTGTFSKPIPLFTSSDPLLICLKVLLLGTSFTSVALNVLVIFALRQQKGRHANIRVITANISATAIVHGCAIVAKSSHFLTNVGRDKNFMVTALECTLQEFVPMCALRTASFAVVGTACERFLATQFHATYEKRSAIFSITFAVASWIQGIGWSLAGVLILAAGGETVFNATKPFCANMFAGNIYLLGGGICFLLLCSLSSLIAYAAIYRMNLRLIHAFNSNQLNLTLSSRLQLKHSIETTLNLTPSVAAHAIVRGINQVYVCCIMFLTDQLPFMHRVNLSVSAELILTVYFLLHAVLLFAYSLNLQEKILESLLVKLPFVKGYATTRLQRLREDYSVPSTGGNVEAKVYFDELTAAWNSKALGDNLKEALESPGLLRAPSISPATASTSSGLNEIQLINERTEPGTSKSHQNESHPFGV